MRVNWGGYSEVQAVLNAMQEICENKISGVLDYVFLLSGQDYPLKPNEYIFNFLGTNYGKEFISYRQIAPGSKEEECIRVYFLNDIWLFAAKDRGSESEGKSHTKLGDCLYRYLKKLPKRKYLERIIPYSGSEWWCLTFRCIKFILDFVKNNNKFVRFYKYTHTPAEMFFQTIILNSPFSKAVVNECLTYAHWLDEHGKVMPRPLVFSKKNFSELKELDKLFARKFNINFDKEVLDLIDKNLLKIG